MPHFLDTLPFDWTQPAAQELRDFLADTYFREERVVGWAQQAGVRVADLRLGRPMSLVWHNLIEVARNQGRLRPLLGVIESGADADVAARLREFVQSEPVIEAPAAPGRAGVWKEFSEPSELERQIFRSASLLDVAFLRRGVELAPAVARLLVTLPSGQFYGTAFRIGDDLLLTNHHVLYDDKTAAAPATGVEAWFGYERDFSGRDLAHQVVRCRPDTIAGGKAHDWAVIRTASAMPAGTPLIGLSEAEPVAEGDRVYIIQHPNGGVKKVGVHHNVVRYADDDVVQYWTDTEAGSSGSPVFDSRWQLVALHHRWVQYGPIEAPEYRNQGIRIERVVNGLKSAGVL